MAGLRVDVAKRLWRRVTKTPNEWDCWEWQGAKNDRGYGVLGMDNRVVYAHRLSWELRFGPIPEGLEICHHCDNPICVNPRHLFLGTHVNNMFDRSVKGRTARGSSLPFAKLNEADIELIREEYAKGRLRQYQLAEKYGVCQPHISDIVNNKRWKHLDCSRSGQ